MERYSVCLLGVLVWALCCGLANASEGILFSSDVTVAELEAMNSFPAKLVELCREVLPANFIELVMRIWEKRFVPLLLEHGQWSLSAGSKILLEFSGARNLRVPMDVVLSVFYDRQWWAWWFCAITAWSYPVASFEKAVKLLGKGVELTWSHIASGTAALDATMRGTYTFFNEATGYIGGSGREIRLRAQEHVSKPADKIKALQKKYGSLRDAKSWTFQAAVMFGATFGPVAHQLLLPNWTIFLTESTLMVMTNAIQLGANAMLFDAWSNSYVESILWTVYERVMNLHFAFLNLVFGRIVPADMTDQYYYHLAELVGRTIASPKGMYKMVRGYVLESFAKRFDLRGRYKGDSKNRSPYFAMNQLPKPLCIKLEKEEEEAKPKMDEAMSRRMSEWQKANPRKHHDPSTRHRRAEEEDAEDAANLHADRDKRIRRERAAPANVHSTVKNEDMF